MGTGVDWNIKVKKSTKGWQRGFRAQSRMKHHTSFQRKMKAGSGRQLAYGGQTRSPG